MSVYIESLVGRCAQQQNTTESLGSYNQVLGDYGEADFAPGVPLEMFLVQRIAKLLAQPGGPAVLAADIGGGAGTTWLKLAGTFEGPIARRQLGLFVTNRSGAPQDFWQRYKAEYGETVELARSQELHRLYGDGVHYLNADFSALDPLTRSFKGLLSVVHERRSVTAWSKIPELHIPRLGSLVAGHGVYLVDGVDAEDIYGATTAEEYLGRREGIKAGQETLSGTCGLIRVNALEAGPHAGLPLDYAVFKGSTAMPVGVGRD